MIEVHNLTKVYRRQHKEAGVRASMRSIFRPTYEEVQALKSISFQAQSGEIIGYIGPNGAGKTTTLKILAGVLFPTSGDVSVLGESPYRRTRQFLSDISFIMASRGFLEEIVWDLPVIDGFSLIKEIYGIPLDTYRTRVDMLSAMMKIDGILTSPVRNLSHGQRKKAEIVAGLLWKPRLIFLDEPTLGLDVFSQNDLYSFLRNYAQQYDATIMLTSHYMKDIERCATRIIMVDKGVQLYDGSVAGLKKKIFGRRYIKVRTDEEGENLERWLHCIEGVSIVAREGDCLTFSINETVARDIAKAILNEFSITDITITEPTLEDAVCAFYEQ